jgi:hypothetical protein
MLKYHRDTETIQTKKWATEKKRRQTPKLRRTEERSDNRHRDQHSDQGCHKDRNNPKTGAPNCCDDWQRHRPNHSLRSNRNHSHRPDHDHKHNQEYQHQHQSKLKLKMRNQIQNTKSEEKRKKKRDTKKRECSTGVMMSAEE